MQNLTKYTMDKSRAGVLLLLVLALILPVSYCQKLLKYIQWNLRTTDTLGAGSSSVVERLSASGGFDKIN